MSIPPGGPPRFGIGGGGGTGPPEGAGGGPPPPPIGAIGAGGGCGGCGAPLEIPEGHEQLINVTIVNIRTTKAFPYPQTMVVAAVGELLLPDSFPASEAVASESLLAQPRPRRSLPLLHSAFDNSLAPPVAEE